MKTKNFCKKRLIPIAVMVLLNGAVTASAAPMLVDSYLGGVLNSHAPFAGLTAVTSSWQNLGGIFVPSVTSQLVEFDVSIFAEPGTEGSARLTIFRYDHEPGESVYLNIGPTLGYAEVPVFNNGPLVAFDFSSQSIHLHANQTYAYMLSNPQFSTLDTAWRLAYYDNPLGLNINSDDSFVPVGFHYASVLAGTSPHYEVWATPVSEPSVLTFAVAILVGAALRKFWRTIGNMSRVCGDAQDSHRPLTSESTPTPARVA
jgi:hypothetical protein